MAGLYLLKGDTAIEYTKETVAAFNQMDIATKQTAGMIEVIANVRLSAGLEAPDPDTANFLRLYNLYGGAFALLQYAVGDEYIVKHDDIAHD